MADNKVQESFVVSHLQSLHRSDVRWRLSFWVVTVIAILLLVFAFFPSEENVLAMIEGFSQSSQDKLTPKIINALPSEMTADPRCANDPNALRCGAEMERLFSFLPAPFPSMIVFMRGGIRVTILVTVASYLITLVVGLFGGLGRLSKSKIVSGISTFYVEMVRGIPLLVQLLWWYFAFPAILQKTIWPNYQANAIAMAILGLVFCYGAYMSEIYRAGIQSISKGQMEAALSVGMSRFQALRFIIVPQAIRVILPPMGNEFIALLKTLRLSVLLQ